MNLQIFIMNSKTGTGQHNIHEENNFVYNKRLTKKMYFLSRLKTNDRFSQECKTVIRKMLSFYLDRITLLFSNYHLIIAFLFHVKKSGTYKLLCYL